MFSQKNLIAVILASATLLGVAVPLNAVQDKQAKDHRAATEAATQLASISDLSNAFAHVSQAIKPSVVFISTAKKAKTALAIQQMPEAFLRGPFKEFFPKEFFDRFEQQTPHQRDFVWQGQGSGVIVSEDGYILTNNHVVAQADEVTVTLSDNRKFRAEVIGTDPKSDLAVVKIETDGLFPAKFGDSANVKIGQWVVAAGNPFGLSNTLTAGIVSATGRSNVGLADYEDFIQTDAAINPGNSGGPLVNLSGEVIGINTAIFSRSGGYMGVGFAIPVDLAQNVMASLIESGHVVRGFLGVMIQDLDEAMAATFDYDRTTGALVGSVSSNGPGGKAGMKAGDIVLTYNGVEVENVKQLRHLVADTAPGEKVNIEVYRDGKHKTLYATIGTLEDDAPIIAGKEDSGELGMSIRTLSEELAARLGMEDVEGVVVTEVEPFSPAARAGIREKDVITTVHGAPVTSASEFRRELSKHDIQRGIRLRVRTGADERFVVLKELD